MTEIGEFSVKSFDNVVIIRNKIKSLFENLGFSNYKAIRTAGITSDICRGLINDGNSIELKLKFYSNLLPKELSLEFYINKKPDNFIPIDNFFDEIDFSSPMGNDFLLTAKTKLPENGKQFSDSDLEQIIKDINTPSQEELFQLIQEKNNELESRAVELSEANKKIASQNSALDENAIISHSDTDGNITYVNEKFCEFYEYTLEELKGKNHRIINSGFHPKVFWKNVWDTISSGKVIRKEIKNKSKKGKHYWMDTVIAPILDDSGKPKEYISIRFDITNRKKLEAELARSKIIAEEATKTKSQFLATMSHEIRTPMNAIIGLTNLALKTELDEKQKDYLQKVDRSANALLGIINDILDFSKIEAGKLNIENIEFELETVLDSVSNLNSQKAQDKGLEFAINIAPDVPLYLIGDPLRVGQIITNFCSNAIKFTHEGEIVVEISVAEKISNDKLLLQFSVKDTGIGLSNEQASKMFHEFSQADSSTTRKYGGTGLGLAISKKLAGLMNGKTWVKSKKGEGSTFYFTGVFGIQEKQRRVTFEPSDDLKGLKVLVCDDNDTSRVILSKAMQRFSFNAITVKSAKEALAVLEKEEIKLLLVDWLMPEMTGLELIQKIKEENRFPELKIIMVTAFGKEDIARQAGKFGIEGYITKPFTFSTMFDRIMAAFDKNIRTKRKGVEKGKKHKDAVDKIRGANLLVVEDNEINQQVVSELLESEEFSVEIAGNGKIAYEMVQNSGVPSKYNLIFMDIQMPVMDGFNSTREIRKLSEYKDLPIIGLTADAMAGTKEKCLEAGMNDFVTKPIDPDNAFGAMVKWINPASVINKRTKPIGRSNNIEQEKIDIVIPEIEGVNIKHGLAHIGGNKNLYLSLLEKFYKGNKNFKNELQKALESGDPELSERIVHTLKGVSGNLGMTNLFELSQDLETKIKTDINLVTNSDIQNVWEKLKTILEKLNENLKLSDSQAEKTVFDLEYVKPKLNELKNKLEENDPEAVKILEEIGIIRGYENEVDELINEIKAYDFDSALETLMTIK